jgi:alpha-glucosidase
MKIKLAFCLPVIFISVLSYSQDLISPDHHLSFSLQSVQGELQYRINYQDIPVILPSQLGISGWERELEIESVLEESTDTVWKPVYGERAVVRDHYNQKTYIIKSNMNTDRLHIIVRAYNEGIAFRYKYVTVGNYHLRITSEKTTFRTPQNTYCWFAPFAQAEHQKLPIKEWPDEAERPLTLQLGNGLYAALCEAEMVNYSRTKFFINEGEENIIRCKMYDAVEEIAPFASPWRVVMVARQPEDLVNNNDIILNLNPPCKIENTSWIKPGKVMRVTRLSTEAGKRMVDFAVKHKLNYIHFDSGWYGVEISKEADPRKSNAVGGLDMQEVVEYARSKGVKVWLYVNQRALSNYLDDILPIYQLWGIAGIKFGFVLVGSFHWSSWLHDAVKKCAKYQLMVDIHDEYRPTGFSRTWPNLLTQEGVRGNEEFPDGINNTTLPFTRFIAGAADATVCYFHRRELKPDLEKRNARTLQNTACHQMALSVINYSPLQFLYWYDTPDDVNDEPELEFFDQLPTVWDDSKVLDGKIGEYVSMARKKDNVWFVACITNNDARKMDLPLDFLDPLKTYELTLYSDGGEKVKTRTHVAIETKKVTAKTILKLDMQPRGGYAMMIREK